LKAFGQLFLAFAKNCEFNELGTLDRKEAVLSRSLLQRLEEEGVKSYFDLLSLNFVFQILFCKNRRFWMTKALRLLGPRWRSLRIREKERERQPSLAE
jgi:hypothetical protein